MFIRPILDFKLLSVKALLTHFIAQEVTDLKVTYKVLFKPHTINDQISPQFRIAPLLIKPPWIKTILRNKPHFRISPRELIRFFTIITVLRFFAAKE